MYFLPYFLLPHKDVTFHFSNAVLYALCCSATWQERISQLMPGEFLLQFRGVIDKGRQDVLTPPGWPLWRTTYHFTTSLWKMPPSWHWTGQSGGYWQPAELSTEMVQAKQWWWWWWWWRILIITINLHWSSLVLHSSPFFLQKKYHRLVD